MTTGHSIDGGTSRVERYLAHLDDLSGGAEPKFSPVASTTRPGRKNVTAIGYSDLVVSSTQEPPLRPRELGGGQLLREACPVRVSLEFAGVLRGEYFRCIGVSEHDDSCRMLRSPVK